MGGQGGRKSGIRDPGTEIRVRKDGNWVGEEGWTGSPRRALLDPPVGGGLRSRAPREGAIPTRRRRIIRRAVPPGPRRLHPARRSFQAIRICINDEMGHLDRFLETLPSVLSEGGRCVVISYHSLEDRRVKNAFRDGAKAGLYAALTRKPLRPSLEEMRLNPRSRSARLRAVRRKTPEDTPR